MNIDRRRLLKLVTLSGLTLIAGCSESDDEKVARVERAIEAHKQGPVVLASSKDDLLKKDNETEDAAKKTVLFAAANLQDPFQRLQSGLLEVAVGKLDDCKFKVLDGGGDAGAQIKQLMDARPNRPAVLILWPVDAAATGKLAAEMRKEGTFVVGVDERLTPEVCSAVVFVTQKTMGTLAGQEIISALKRKAADEGKPTVSGRVVHLLGDANAFATKARSEGLHEALAAEPGIIIVHEAAGAWSLDGGKARTEDALRLQHEFDVVCAQNDAMAQGASEVLTVAQKREQVLVVGMDGGLELVRKSVIDVTILQPMPLQKAFGFVSKAVADPHFIAPGKTEMKPVALTPPNIDDFVAKNLQNTKN